MTVTDAIHKLREVIRRQRKAKDVLGSPLQNVVALHGTRSAHLRHAPIVA